MYYVDFMLIIKHNSPINKGRYHEMHMRIGPASYIIEMRKSKYEFEQFKTLINVSNFLI